MFDSITLQPVIIAMCLYLLLINIVPVLVKKPTGVKIIDDTIILIISQRPMAMSGTIFIGLIVLLTEYIKGYFET
jgi:hypothetical protein